MSAGDPSDSGSSRGAPEFLHRSVADALRRRLTEGTMADGSKLPALREMADEFDVSTMTVRQAIHALEREGLVYRIPGVGAFVRPTPPGRRATQTTLAFVGGDFRGSFQMDVACGVQQACQRRGWGLQLFDAHYDEQQENRNLEKLPDSGARATIVLPPVSSQTTADTLREMQSPDFPLVLIDQTVAGLQADLVASDHEQGAYRGTRYLLERGHSQVLMLTHPPLASSIVERIQGYQRALREAGIASSDGDIVYIDPVRHQTGYRAGQWWLGACEAILPRLHKTRCPMAVLAVEAYTGWGLYRACQKAGLSIPEDVSVVAFDDHEITRALEPAMTIIAQRTDDIGEAAVDLVEQRLQARSRPEIPRKMFSRIIIDMDLVERDSVRLIEDRPDPFQEGEPSALPRRERSGQAGSA